MRAGQRVRWWGISLGETGDDHGDWGTVDEEGLVAWDGIDGTNDEPLYPHDRFGDGQVIVGCLTPEDWAALEGARLLGLVNELAVGLGLVGASR